MTSRQDQEEKYNDYLKGMKEAYRQSMSKAASGVMSPRERHRHINEVKPVDQISASKAVERARIDQNTRRISTIASMVPDEIISLQHRNDSSIQRYESVLMFIDVSGFTDLCEAYTRAGREGPSRLTQVLNTYIGAMVQEILAHDGDVLQFSGDAFLSMWKVAPALSAQDALHAALDCGLSIQNNLGTYRTDIGVVMKVKVAISAGISHFSVIGGAAQSHYVIVGQPVWDVKVAEYFSTAGDVLTSASVWKYVEEAEYLTKPYGDGRHMKVLGVGNSWKRVEKIAYSYGLQRVSDQASYRREYSITEEDVNYYREFSLRPSVISAIRSTWWPSLRRFMVKPVLRAVDNDEPMQFLAEVRRVVVVFLNIVTRSVSEKLLVRIVDDAYQCVCSVTSAAGGLVNKVSMFDKDMMFLVVFGLRGLKHEDEAQKALLCALTIKDNLNDPNITSVSIGITSGTTYCGVVGHVLRREYTVIGSAVNKAARLMIAYENKVSCDKETFLRSKLEHEFFKLQKFKPLKGFHNPGPIYEFDKVIYPERLNYWRHPLIGRNEELRKFRTTLDDAIKLQHQKFIRYRDHVYGIAFLGPELVGKTRLMDECIILTPKNIQVLKITPKSSDRMPYGLFRQIAMKMLAGSNEREKCENKIRTSIDLQEMTPFQLFTMNTIFGCRFPLPEDFSHTGAILEDQKTRNLVQRIFRSNIPSLWVVAVDEVNNIDDESWQLLLILMEAKTIFAILTVCDQVTMSDVAYKCLSNNMILKLHLSGIERWYHAALACQLLDVQAIPADLEKVIQSASGGMPGWIQNFVISLIQRGALSVETMTLGEAQHLGAVMPPMSLLQREDDAGSQKTQSLIVMSRGESTNSGFSPPASDDQVLELPTDVIQMAILDESHNFDAKVDMTMDALILKTYDSLTPFEKMFLKCSSVLGDVFSRRMLLHLLQSDSPRKVAQAVAKLFSIRVLECEGGDFTRETSMVLVHPAPALPGAKPPYCACLGIRKLPDCRDLPMYAFCGYMKFKHPLFRTTTYDLLTESQKREMHSRALLYLERYTRRCIACGAGCFNRLLGERCNDGLIIESKELIRTRDMMRALADETRVVGESSTTFSDGSHHEIPVNAYFREHTDAQVLVNEELLELRRSVSRYRKDKHIRPFVSPEFADCECLTIILSVYCQIIDHCRGAGEYKKLYEAYLEYADLCVMNSNVPQAIRLLFEVEAFVMNDKYCFGLTSRISWLKRFRLARILSLRGACMLESGDLAEARKHLFQALELYNDPFPTSKYRVKMRGARASIRQFLTLRVVPKLYVASERGTIGRFYEEIAETLNRLYKLFSKCKETSSAYLAAKQAFAYALRTNSNFRLLCESYGNLITISRQKKGFSMCLRLEKQAMDLCNRKRGELDATEVQAVCFLYTSVFLFYVEYGKKSESLEFGLSVVQMITSLTDQTTRQLLINWILKLLLSDLRIEDMVVLMREFFYLTDDMNSITWYHFYAMVIFLDTGFCVESYQACEMFYIKRGDAILRSKTPDAAWYFFVSMWLITIRMGAWERGILWEDKIKQIMSMGLKKHASHVDLLLRLAEGFLIMLVREIDNRNLKKIRLLNKIVKDLFNDLDKDCHVTSLHRPRYFLLNAYCHIIRGNKGRAYKHLNKAIELAKQFKHGTILIWAEHTEQHWKGALNPALIDYWVGHVEPDCILDYRDFNQEYGKRIVPYTLPLPRDVERTK